GKPGLQAEYRAGVGMATASKPIAKRIEPTVDLNANDLPTGVPSSSAFTAEWTGFIDPPKSGDYLLGVKADGFAQVTVGDEQVVRMYIEASNMSPVHLEKGHPAKLD